MHEVPNSASGVKPDETKRQQTPVWNWTGAVVAADVRPLTKLVCLNIARYLSDAGKGWRITAKEMMRDTGLCNQALSQHLKNARVAGLLEITRHHNSKGHRTGTTYTPRFPENVTLATEPAELPPSLDVTDTSGGLDVTRTRVRGTRQEALHRQNVNQRRKGRYGNYKKGRPTSSPGSRQPSPHGRTVQ